MAPQNISCTHQSFVVNGKIKPIVHRCKPKLKFTFKKLKLKLKFMLTIFTNNFPQNRASS